MPKRDILLMQAEPGYGAYYTLDELLKRRNKADPSECGICGSGNSYWIGRRAAVAGEDVLRVSLAAIQAKRDEEYLGYDANEIYIFVGIDDKTKEFTWFLLNKDEALLYIKEAEVESVPCLN